MVKLRTIREEKIQLTVKLGKIITSNHRLSRIPAKHSKTGINPKKRVSLCIHLQVSHTELISLQVTDRSTGTQPQIFQSTT